MKDHLVKYVHYNLWANTRVCDFLKQLTDEQVEKEIVSSFPSVKKTVSHISGAQQVWLNRLDGISPSSSPIQDFKGSLEEATTGLLHTSEEIITFVESANEELLESVLRYKTMNGKEHENKISDVIQYVIDHSIFHRGQIISGLRQLGFSKLFVTDYIAWNRE